VADPTKPDARSPDDLRRRLAVLVLFGVVFGYAEAATVVYIRMTLDPIHQRVFPDRAADDLFPLLTAEQWSREAPATATAFLEISRELSTVLLVASVALATSRDVRQWFASFMLTFGVWDLFYYLWLRLLLGWPRTLQDWDLIFAAPLPWVGPVWAPLLVATVMVVSAGLFFRLEASPRPLRPRAMHWVAVLTGALMIMTAFWWDARHLLANGVPEWFNWPLLSAGLILGLAGFLHALYHRA
jgi:hypothetical protein